MKNEADKIIRFTILYNRYKQRLYNFLLRLSNNQMTAEDITQNVFLKFFEKYDTLQNPESANYWLFKSARNEYLNYYRKIKREGEITDDLLDQKPDELEMESFVELKEIKSIVLNELNKMEYDQKEVYLLKEYGGLSYKEIADTLDIEVNLVKSRLYKVRQKLINKISKLV